MKIKPLKDRILVAYPKQPQEKTAGGIYIPDSAQQEPQEGNVLAVGSEVKEVKVGDLLFFDKYAGTKIKIEGTEHCILKEEEVLCIKEKEVHNVG